MQREFVRSLLFFLNLLLQRESHTVTMSLPPSRLTSGTRVMPEMTLGMPMTSPEKVALPPKSSAYLLPEETMIKNVVCMVDLNDRLLTKLDRASRVHYLPV